MSTQGQETIIKAFVYTLQHQLLEEDSAEGYSYDSEENDPIEYRHTVRSATYHAIVDILLLIDRTDYKDHNVLQNYFENIITAYQNEELNEIIYLVDIMISEIFIDKSTEYTDSILNNFPDINRYF